jgi:hypothetical protein
MLASMLAFSAVAHADDRAEVSTSLFSEQRAGGKGGLTVVHPQLDIGTDIGNHVSLDVGYAADAVSGATESATGAVVPWCESGGPSLGWSTMIGRTPLPPPLPPAAPSRLVSR